MIIYNVIDIWSTGTAAVPAGLLPELYIFCARNKSCFKMLLGPEIYYSAMSPTLMSTHSGTAVGNVAAERASSGSNPCRRDRCHPGRLREPPKGIAVHARKTAVTHSPHPLPGEMNRPLEAKKEIYIETLLMF